MTIFNQLKGQDTQAVASKLVESQSQSSSATSGSGDSAASAVRNLPMPPTFTPSTDPQDPHRSPLNS